MRLKEIADDPVLKKIMETSTAGATSAGSIGSLPSTIGTVIKRVPTEPNLFGYKNSNKRNKRKPKRKG
jgi:hypothetical protein